MPRKSNASMLGEDGTPIPSGMSVEDLNLPKTMVNRLAKGVLPTNMHVQAVSQSAISKSATVFVNYLTAHASDIASRSNKKTIQPKDVFEALKELEFEAFIPRVESELQRYNTIQCDKRNSYRRRLKEEKKASEGGTTGATDGEGAPVPAAAPGAEGAPGTNGHVKVSDEDDGAPASKKMRRDVDDSAMDQEDEAEGEGEGEEDVEDEQDEEGEDEEEEEVEEEDDEEADDAAAAAQLREDPLEEKEGGDGEDSAGSEEEGSDW